MKSIILLPLLLFCVLHGKNLMAMEDSYFLKGPDHLSGDTTPKPAIIPEKIILQSFPVLYIRDTLKGKTMGRMFEIDFVRLFSYARRNDRVTGRPMAFYISLKDPVIVDVTIETDRMPDSLSGGIQYRIIEGGEGIVSHYKGPYEEIEMAYKALFTWLKTNNRKPKGQPFEIYLNDPGTTKDANELRTDVYQLLQ